MPSLDLEALKQSPEFLAASPEAKRLFLSKHVPEFGKASPEAQGLFIDKHFSREATAAAPTKSFWNRAGEAALRTGGPMVGAALASAAAPEAIPFSTMAGAAVGSTAVSKYYGDTPKETTLQAGLAAVAPGPGKTLVRSVAKGTGFSMGAATIDEISQTGELPSRGRLALSALVGGTVGYFGKALPDWISKKLTSRYHIEEILPKDVAADAEQVLSGKAPAGVPKAEVEDIRRFRANFKLQGKRGFMGKTEAETTTRHGAEPITITEQRTVHTGRKYQKIDVTSTREITKEDIFPQYHPAEPITRGKLQEGHFPGINRPRWLAAHVQDETGVPVYDDVYKPLREVYGDRERTSAETDRIINKYLRDKSLDPGVKDIIGRYVVAVQGHEDSRSMIYMMKRVGKLMGRELDDDTARRWGYNVLSSPYAAGMPLRAGPVGRIFAHTFQIGVLKTGWGYLARGMTRAMTPEGWREAARAGVIGAEHLSVPEETLSTFGRFKSSFGTFGAGQRDVPEEIMGAGRGWYKRALEMGFGPFRYSQDASRVSLFHATRERAKDALDSGVKTFEEFAKRTGLNVGIPKPEVERMRFLWEQGRLGELVDSVGVVHVDSYIPGHTNLDRPFYASGVMSGQATALARGARPERFASVRFGIQYANWPSFYGQTLYENFREGPAAERAVMFGRWAVANAALGVAAYELYGEGKEAFEKAASLVGPGPLFYSLGAGLEDIKNISRGGAKVWSGAVEMVTGDDADVGQKHMMQGFRQIKRGLPIPFSGAYKDLHKFLLGEEDK